MTMNELPTHQTQSTMESYQNKIKDAEEFACEMVIACVKGYSTIGIAAAAIEQYFSASMPEVAMSEPVGYRMISAHILVRDLITSLSKPELELAKRLIYTTAKNPGNKKRLERYAMLYGDD